MSEEIRVVIFTMFSNFLSRENLRWRFSHKKVLLNWQTLAFLSVVKRFVS